MTEHIERQSVFFGRGLYFLAAYTFIIKYILPVLWALRQHAPLHAYVFFWDAWWIAHLAVGACLTRRRKGIWFWAFVLAVSEIVIITVKFVFYFKSPNLDFWHLNWFANKSFLLVYFWGLLIWLLRKESRELL